MSWPRQLTTTITGKSSAARSYKLTYTVDCALHYITYKTVKLLQSSHHYTANGTQQQTWKSLTS